MLSIAVCDDDELHRKRTVALIRNTPGFENSLIREFSRAENLLDSISEDRLFAGCSCAGYSNG